MMYSVTQYLKGRKYLLAAIFALIIAAGLAGYNYAGLKHSHESCRIGIITFDDKSVLESDILSAVVSRFKKDDHTELFIKNAAGDSKTQARHLVDLTELGCNAVIIIGNHYGIDRNAVYRAEANGAKIIAVQSFVTGGIDCYIGTMPYDEGYAQGTFLRYELPSGANIVYLRSRPTSFFSAQRLLGFSESCLIYRPDVNIALDMDAGDTFASAQNVVSKNISRLGRVDAVVAQSDDVALGAKEAIVSAGLPAPKAYGINAASVGRNAIEKGNLRATVSCEVEKIAEEAVKATRKLLNGESTINCVINPQIITSDQLTEIIK